LPPSRRASRRRAMDSPDVLKAAGIDYVCD
jgi:hypothetical protein